MAANARWSTLTLLLVASLSSGACDREPTPPPAPPVAPPPPAPAAVEIPVWTVDNIAELKPVPPPRVLVVPRPLPELPDYEVALKLLGDVVERHAGDPENAWAIAHGLLARGKDFRLTDGRLAVPRLFSAWAQPHTFKVLIYPVFPTHLGDSPVEPHSDLLLKNLQEAGVAPDDEQLWSGGTGKTSAADLDRATLLKTFLVPEKNQSSYDSPNDTPWSLQALAWWAPGPELRWVSENGTPMDLDDLTDFGVAVLHKESQFLFRKMQNGEKFDRAGEPLFSYTCGGAHLLQGVSYAVSRGYGSAKAREIVTAQVKLWFWRYPGELALYDDAVKNNRKYVLKLTVQRLKFLGHFLESMSRMGALGLYTPDDAQLELLEGAAQHLVLTVTSLKKLGAFEKLDKLKVEDHQLYLDLVGDSAHAVRGLELALGRGKLGG